MQSSRQVRASRSALYVSQLLVTHDVIAYGHRSKILLVSQRADQPPLVLKATRLDGAVAPMAAPDGGSPSTQAERVRREIELSGLALGPFVVASHGWLSLSAGESVSQAQACLLLDYLPGGDLDLLVDRNGPLGPQAARFYVGCAALGLEAMHARGIAHRDVKPENLCIDAAGYAVIADLGFARRLPPQEEGDDGRARTLLGTPEYLSPEVFLNEGHGTPSDLWALGATLYTLLLSAHPYGGQTTDEIYSAALKGAPFFPQRVMPDAAAELVTQMLARDPAARPTAASLWDHRFFAAGAFLRADDLTRDAVLGRTATPPFVPRLRSPLDVTHFELPEPGSDEEGFSDDGEAGGGGAGGGGGDGGGGGGGVTITVQQPGGGVALAALAALAAPSEPPRRRGAAATFAAGDRGGDRGIELPGVGGGALRRGHFHPPDRPCASVEELLAGSTAAVAQG